VDPAATWHRLHPLSPVIRAGRLFVGAVIVFAGTLLPGSHTTESGAITRAVIGVVVIAFGVVSWLVTRWRVEGNDLRIETGLIRRSSLRFPLPQIQAIDVVRPVLARIFGLAAQPDTWIEVDTEHTWTVQAAAGQSRCGWSPLNFQSRLKMAVNSFLCVTAKSKAGIFACASVTPQNASLSAWN